MNVGRITIDLVLNDAGDEVLEVETAGNLAFVTALGMLRMAELRLVDDINSEEPPVCD